MLATSRVAPAPESLPSPSSSTQSSTRKLSPCLPSQAHTSRRRDLTLGTGFAGRCHCNKTLAADATQLGHVIFIGPPLDLRLWGFMLNNHFGGEAPTLQKLIAIFGGPISLRQTHRAKKRASRRPPLQCFPLPPPVTSPASELDLLPKATSATPSSLAMSSSKLGGVLV